MTAYRFIDLHFHSTASDGRLTPVQLMEEAAHAGLGLVSLTDHDTLEGVLEAEGEARARGIRLVPGVEISTVHNGRSRHLLAYFADLSVFSTAFSSFLARLRRDREDRFEKIVERLQRAGYPLDPAPVREAAGGGAITRAHVAAGLVAQGLIGSRVEAFNELLGDGKSCFVPYQRPPTTPQVIALVRANGGLSSLAHPGTQKVRMKELKLLAKAGLDAIEVAHPGHDAATRRTYRTAANRLGLLETGGSDYHGQPHSHLIMSAANEGGVPLRMRQPFLDALAAARSRRSA